LAYNHVPATSEGLLRSMIYDTSTEATPVKGTDYYFDDDELTAILDQNGDDLWAAASDCCRSLAALFAKEAIELGLGKRDIYINKKERSKFYLQLASQYSSISVGSGGITEYIDSVNYDIGADGVDDSEYMG